MFGFIKVHIIDLFTNENSNKFKPRVKKRVSERVSLRVLHRIRSETLSETRFFARSVIGVKFPGEKKKKFVVNKVLNIISYKNVKARALGHLENVNTFCDNLD